MQIHENVARILLNVKHEAKFSIKQPKSHLLRAPRREHYIVFVRYNIMTRAHIVLILHYIESGIIICSKKTVDSITV